MSAIAAFQTKGVKDAPSPPSYGPHWSVSRRGKLRLFADRAELGSWRIAFEDVKEATLWSVRTQLGIKSTILELRTNESTYQFGLNPWADIRSKLRIPVEERATTMRYTAFSWIIRIALVAVIGWVLWDLFGG